MQKPFFFLLTSFSLLFLFTVNAEVQGQTVAIPSTSALIVSPYNEVVTLNKGSTTTFIFNLNNTLDTPVTVRTTFEDFTAPADGSGTPQYFLSTENDNGSVFAHGWFLPIPDITIKAHTYVKQSITMTVPQNATPGGHYAGIQFAPTQQLTSNQNPGVSLTGKIAIPIIITVNGALTHALSISSFTINPSFLNTYTFINGQIKCFFTSKCSLSANAVLKDTGNVHEAPIGVVEVDDMFGNKVFSTSFNPKGALVLPNSSRNFTTTIDPNRISGLKIGNYTVKLVSVYGDNTEISMESSFTLLDDTYIVGIVLILFIIGSAYVFRKYNKKKLHNRYI